MKKFIRLWSLSFLIMTLTHFLIIASILGIFDITTIIVSFILAFIVSIIPTGIYSAIFIFGSPFVKNKYVKLGLQIVLGLYLLGFSIELSVINTITVLITTYFIDHEPSISKIEPKREASTFYVYDNEVVGRPLINGPEQLIYSILKEKGAPIDGTVYFKIQDAYEVKTYPIPHKFCRVYEFTK
jgi:hypothetical protein